MENAASPSVSDWIRDRFKKRECIRVVPISKDSSKCGCGRHLALHYYYEGEEEEDVGGWNVERCTGIFPTDVYGTLMFRTGKGHRKARYIRTDYDTDPLDLWRLIVEVWGLEPPSLVITVQDGMENQSALAHGLVKAIKKGLSKAARTGTTWILTSGLKTGINQVATSFNDSSWRGNKAQRIYVIGFASWGQVRGADQLISKSTDNENQSTVPVRYCHFHGGYDEDHHASWFLGEGHSGFVLVDDGTIGQSTNTHGLVRRRFEHFLNDVSLRKIGGSRVFTVCLMVNGTLSGLDTFINYVTCQPPVPVVTVAGTGGLADWISLISTTPGQEGDSRIASLERRLIRQIQSHLSVDKIEANELANLLHNTIHEKKDLITVFRVSSTNPQSIPLDVVILYGLLKGLRLSEPEKLNLTVAWDREDLAREILENATNVGYDWPEGSLDEAMMNALMYDRVDFVHLLLSSGVTMDRFLTVARLEQLYNSDNGPANTLRFILRDVVKNVSINYKHRLPHIGLVIEKLMGNGYRSLYRKREFQRKQTVDQMRAQRISTIMADTSFSAAPRSSIIAGSRSRPHFVYPYHELFIWAVLTNRKKLAMRFWQEGQEQLAKALVGAKLYESLAQEAEEDYLEMEICQQLQGNAHEFKTLACELLAQCYENDDNMTLQLLTYELRQFSKFTCISLAVWSKNETFVAHQSCQLLLADLWLGGLRLRKNINLKVFLCMLFPPLVATLTFKTKEELQLQAQTAEESETYRGQRDGRNKSWAEISSSEASTEDESEAMEDVESMLTEEFSKHKTPVGQSECPPIHMVSSESSMPRRNSNPESITLSASTTFKVDNSKETRKHSTLAPSMVTVDKTARFRKFSGRQLSLEDLTVSANRCQSDEEQRVRFSNVDCIPDETGYSRKRLRQRSATEYDLNVKQLAPQRLADKPPVLPSSIPKYRQELEIGRKFLEFYKAPVTTFFASVIAYALFISCFTYTVLVKTPINPEWPEYYVIAYFATFSMDQMRKVLLQEPRQLSAKIHLYTSSSVWDSCSALACISFFLALILRLDPGTLSIGRVLYCVNIGFWYLYLLKLLSINSKLNPYIHMYGKMVMRLFLLSTILFIVLASFGIFRQSIMYPNNDWQWAMLRNVGYKPYWYLYGSLYPEEITQCQDTGENCTPGVWLTPLFMMVYMLLTIVVFMNMMVAAFSHIFMEVNARAQEIAKFEAYRQVMEYEQQPFFPPPLTLFAHIYLIIKYLYRRYCRKGYYRFEHSLKLFLNPKDREKLHEFERDCVNELLTKKTERKGNQVELRLQHLAERLDSMSSQVDNLYEKNRSQRFSLLKLGGLIDLANLSLDHSVPGAVLFSPLQSTSDFEIGSVQCSQYDSEIISINTKSRKSLDSPNLKSITLRNATDSNWPAHETSHGQSRNRSESDPIWPAGRGRGTKTGRGGAKR